MTATGRLRTISPTGLLAATAYATLGAVLCWSRLVGLGRSYASDELMTVRDYVRAGPREILAGSYVPNNHELFSLLGWATTQLVGESEVALRLWSVIPFLAGVALVTAWLHVRVGALSGILFLFFCTASPLLLDITRQARGYGLAFLAMAVLIVSALEAERTRRGWLVVVFCAAGVVGTWTLPHFAIGFLATALVLMTMPDLRRATTLALGPAVLAIAVWYAPNLGDILRSSRQDVATTIHTAWLLTAPIDQALIPALIRIDGTVLVPGVMWLPAVAAIVLVLASSPLMGRLAIVLILWSSVVATVVALWIKQVDVVPRFLSFLLVPLLILLASGAAATFRQGRPTPRTLAAGGVVLGAAVAFSIHAPGILRLPREANREAAAAVRERTPATTPVLAYTTHPSAIQFYLGREVTRPATPSDPEVCNRREPVALVVQPWALPRAAFPCVSRPGTTHLRFRQYTRGGEILVWLIPPP